MSRFAGNIWSILLGLALGLLIAAIAISDQSLWIDEANSAVKASQADWSRFVEKLLQDHGSDSQMPLYMAWLWAWEKLFGHSELALRWANAPWFLLACLAILIGLPERRWINLLLMGVNPFVWYYLNEARPYTMQYGGAVLLALGIVQLTRVASSDSSKLLGIWLLSCGAVLTGGASLLGMPFVGIALLVGLFAAYKNRINGCGYYLPLVSAVVIIAGLSFYYFLRLLGGSGATLNTSGTALNLIFCAYELFGFAGIGPGRVDLRSDAISALLHFKWPLCLATLLLIPGMAITLLRERQRPTLNQLTIWAMYVGIPLIFILLVGVFRDFRVLGRHLTPLLPCLLLALGSCNLKSHLARIGMVSVIGVWLCSALMLRFEPRHAKDDYRGAAAVALRALAEGETVLWAANSEAAEYYKVPLSTTPQKDHALYFAAWEWAPASPRSLVPEVVILSKPDLYDSKGLVREAVAREGRTAIKSLQAFQIWKK